MRPTLVRLIFALALFLALGAWAGAIPSKPAQGSILNDYLKSEELPLKSAKASGQEKSGRWGLVQAVLGLAVIGCAAGATFLCVQFLKRRGNRTGSRKYLIEQLSYCPMGPKMGISLIKVGPELVLVGVTSSQISLLSSVPRLQESYLEESRYERGDFQEAVKEEMSRIRGASARAVA